MAGLAGLVSGALALATSEALCRLVPRPSLVLDVGEVVIAHVPPRVSDAVIGMFGRSDKTVLVAGIIVVSLLLAAALGVTARRRFWAAMVGFGLAAVAGALAGISRSPGTPLATVAVVAGGAGAGLLCLRNLLGRRRSSGVVLHGRRQMLQVGAYALA
ncbi:MAG: hypothetical protein M3066_16690, partial [Actinomycetota bacterium]|nr:hypothetical protein [Actinomycetota bacterium]